MWNRKLCCVHAVLLILQVTCLVEVKTQNKDGTRWILPDLYKRFLIDRDTKDDLVGEQWNERYLWVSIKNLLHPKEQRRMLKGVF